MPFLLLAGVGIFVQIFLLGLAILRILAVILAKFAFSVRTANKVSS